MTQISSDRTLRAGAGSASSSLAAGTEQCDPIALFGQWFRQAVDAGVDMPEAMALATCTADAFPSVRMVLLKQFDHRGFVFYTNFTSRKSAELKENPRAALVLHWTPLERQVRIEGTVAEVSETEAAAYFATRPRGSRIGAWASKQSTILPDKSDLEARVLETATRFSNREVPLPPFWGGWRLMPSRIEFWQGQSSRLHDRLVFEPCAGGWKTYRLYP